MLRKVMMVKTIAANAKNGGYGSVSHFVCLSL